MRRDTTCITTSHYTSHWGYKYIDRANMVTWTGWLTGWWVGFVWEFEIDNYGQDGS